MEQLNSLQPCGALSGTACWARGCTKRLEVTMRLTAPAAEVVPDAASVHPCWSARAYTTSLQRVTSSALAAELPALMSSMRSCEPAVTRS